MTDLTLPEAIAGAKTFCSEYRYEAGDALSAADALILNAVVSGELIPKAMSDLDKAIADVKRQTPPDNPWIADDFEDRPALAEQLATILNAVVSGELIPLADHKLVVAEVYRKGEATFMDEVWSALKADATDLRKQQRILKAFRARADTDPLADLDGLAAALKGDDHE